MDDVQRSMESLNDDLLDIVHDYLNDVDSVYDFWFEEADPPDDADIREKINDPEKFISEIVETTIYTYGYLSSRFHDGIPAEIINMIMCTLNRHDAELYYLYPLCWEKYGNKETFGDHIACIVRVRGEADHWYIFWWTWSD